MFVDIDRLFRKHLHTERSNQIKIIEVGFYVKRQVQSIIHFVSVFLRFMKRIGKNQIFFCPETQYGNSLNKFSQDLIKSF